MQRQRGKGRPFEKGNPGRPPGTVSGRARALQALDRILADPENIKTLEKAWTAALREQPLGFWKKVIEPLLPKNATLEVAGSLSLVEMIERLGNDIIDGDRSNPTSEE